MYEGFIPDIENIQKKVYSVELIQNQKKDSDVFTHLDLTEYEARLVYHALQNYKEYLMRQKD